MKIPVLLPKTSDVLEEERQHEKRSEHCVKSQHRSRQEKNDSPKATTENKSKNNSSFLTRFWDNFGVAALITAGISLLTVYVTWYNGDSQQKLAQEKYRQEALQSYIDQMSTLIIDKDLYGVLESKTNDPNKPFILNIRDKDGHLLEFSVNTEAKPQTVIETNPINEQKRNELLTIAKARTLTTLLLQELDPWRRDVILDFLRQDGVIEWNSENSPFQWNLQWNRVSRPWNPGSVARLAQPQYKLPILDIKKIDLNQFDLSKTRLTKTILNLDSQDKSAKEPILANLNLKGVNLSQANLWKADLSNTQLEEANLRGTNLSAARLKGTLFEKADLSQAILEDVDNQGVGSFFQYAILEEASLRSAILPKTIFDQADLKGADFRTLEITNKEGDTITKRQTDLENTSFKGANLEKAQLQGVNLKGANFGKPDLLSDEFQRLSDSKKRMFRKYTNLKNANLQGADLRGAKFAGANLWGANLKNTGVTSEQLGEAKLCFTTENDGHQRFDNCWFNLLN